LNSRWKFDIACLPTDCRQAGMLGVRYKKTFNIQQSIINIQGSGSQA